MRSKRFRCLILYCEKLTRRDASHEYQLGKSFDDNRITVSAFSYGLLAVHANELGYARKLACAKEIDLPQRLTRRDKVEGSVNDVSSSRVRTRPLYEK